jgi:3-deoxy-D-manno-octulosonic-acid transferase
VDTVGELSAWWGLCQVAFVGGSFGDRGGQNMIEPAAYGAAIAVGPNTKNFRDVVELLVARDAIRIVRDPQELAEFVRRCVLEKSWREGLGLRARHIVTAQTGATQRTVAGLAKVFTEPARGRRAA